ncbi:hypothetical protein ADK70_32220 [Streptomyces rimosus subsp. pseudoverticillatus]|nr:hypothetical protein ADK70_32220 [Streptomyces rimosus subsp. pseudoverticillatus]
MESDIQPRQSRHDGATLSFGQALEAGQALFESGSGNLSAGVGEAASEQIGQLAVLTPCVQALENGLEVCLRDVIGVAKLRLRRLRKHPIVRVVGMLPCVVLRAASGTLGFALRVSLLRRMPVVSCRILWRPVIRFGGTAGGEWGLGM